MHFDAFDETQFMREIGDDHQLLKYLHNTPSESAAWSIMRRGFIFAKYLENSTDSISGVDLIELRYFLQHRAGYGRYTVIIQICRDIADEYFNKLKSARFHFSEVLSKYPPRLNSDNDPVYVLPEQYVKGFVDRATNTYHDNPLFNPYYTSLAFDKNIEYLLANDF